MTASPQSLKPAGRNWLEYELILLVVVLLVAHLVRLDALTPRGEESRRANVALEMLRSGDWLVPQQQGEVYFSRPPLQNWLIATVAYLRGQGDIWAARLPSFLATLLSTLLIYGYARTFLSRAGALAAGAAFATMAQVLQIGGLAETEPLFTLFVGGSLLVWHWGYSREWPETLTWVAAYALVALGTLTKGVQAPCYFVGAVGLFLFLSGQLRRFFMATHLLGLLTFAGVFGAWFAPYVARVGWPAAQRILMEQAIERFQFEGWGAYCRHLVEFPLETFACLLPWSLLLLPYLVRPFLKTIGPATPHVRFLFACLAVTFPTCWLAPGADVRYWMPLYPCCACLIGLAAQRGLEAPVGSRLRNWWNLYLTGCGMLLVFLPVIALTGTEIEGHTGWPLSQPGLMAAGFAVTMFALLSLLFGQRQQPGLAHAKVSVFALAGCLALSYSAWYLNILINRSVDTPAAVAQVKKDISGELVRFGDLQHLFTFCYQEPIPKLPWPKTEDDLPTGVTHFCFNTTDHWPELPFAWEPVAVINCDRNLKKHPEMVVVVGRRVSVK